MRIETHQRRIQAAIGKLNEVLRHARDDVGLYPECRVTTTKNSELLVQAIDVRGWEVDEPGFEKDKP